MEITRATRDEPFDLKLSGRLDATWSDPVARALAECVRSGQHRIRVDMAEVDYISSAGIRILVLSARQLQGIQGRLQVIHASGHVRQVLELAGLEALLLAPATGGGATTPSPGGPAARQALPEAGATLEVFELDPRAVLHVQWPGDATPWLAGRAPLNPGASVLFPADALGVGLGALVAGGASEHQAFGEFLAAAGAAVSQPADGSPKPDYLLLQGSLIPTVRIAYGMVGQGGFRHLIRFDKGAQQPHLPLSSVVAACLEVLGTDTAGLVMVAETACLVGASLRRMPGPSASVAPGPELFALPGVRDWLSFTAEPAFAGSTCVMVGFAAAGSASARLRLLKPLIRSGQLGGHFHAAAFPYRPLRTGKVDLVGTVLPLFEAEHVLGVLHLVNDWREANGIGESRLLRGACWCAPLSF
ncbi:MAG: STAS domain-containing protein [Verrucomicrobia bacterium]|nr:STAS domain-containing protein [Verrucomicrobiota bacterium]